MIKYFPNLDPGIEKSIPGLKLLVETDDWLTACCLTGWLTGDVHRRGRQVLSGGTCSCPWPPTWSGYCLPRPQTREVSHLYKHCVVKNCIGFGPKIMRLCD